MIGKVSKRVVRRLRFVVALLVACTILMPQVTRAQIDWPDPCDYITYTITGPAVHYKRGGMELTDLGSKVEVAATAKTIAPTTRVVTVEIRKDIPEDFDQVILTQNVTPAIRDQRTVSIDLIVKKDDLGSPGDDVSIHVHFKVPRQPDADTCHLAFTL